MFDDVVVVYKFLGDLMFYVSGDQDENEVRGLPLEQGLCGNADSVLLWVNWDWRVRSQVRCCLPNWNPPKPPLMPAGH